MEGTVLINLSWTQLVWIALGLVVVGAFLVIDGILMNLFQVLESLWRRRQKAVFRRLRQLRGEMETGRFLRVKGFRVNENVLLGAGILGIAVLSRDVLMAIVVLLLGIVAGFGCCVTGGRRRRGFSSMTWSTCCN